MGHARRTESEAWGTWDTKGLGQRILQVRQALGLTQSGFARLLGPPFDQSIVSRYEGGRALPPLPALVRIATVAGTGWSLDRLVLGREQIAADSPQMAEALGELEAALSDSQAALTESFNDTVSLKRAAGVLKSAALLFPVVRSYPANFHPGATGMVGLDDAEQDPDPIRIDQRLLLLAHPQMTTAYRIPDDSMGPQWPKGSLALVDHALRDERSIADSMVAARQGDQTVVRWCRMSQRHMVLRAERPAAEDIIVEREAAAQIILGIVIWCGVMRPQCSKGER